MSGRAHLGWLTSTLRHWLSVEHCWFWPQLSFTFPHLLRMVWLGKMQGPGSESQVSLLAGVGKRSSPSPVSWAWPLHTSVLSMSSCKQLLTAQSISATNRKLLTGWTPRLARALCVLCSPQSHEMVSIKPRSIPGEREKKNPSFPVSPITPFSANSHHLVFYPHFWSMEQRRSHSVSYLSTL